jgi:hypothetical protein
MAKLIQVSIPHTLGQSEARRRIAEGFGSIQGNKTAGLGSLLSIQDRWEADRLHFDIGGLGQTVRGRLDVLPKSVEIEIEVPALLGMLADRICAVLRTGTQKLLE